MCPLSISQVHPFPSFPLHLPSLRPPQLSPEPCPSWSLCPAHSDLSKAPVSFCHPSPKHPQDRTQLVSPAGKALYSGTSYLALMAPLAPYSGSWNCLCPDSFICHAPVSWYMLFCLSTPVLGQVKAWFRSHFLQTFLGLSWAAFLLVFASLYSSYLGLHQPAWSMTAG